MTSDNAGNSAAGAPPALPRSRVRAAVRVLGASLLAAILLAALGWFPTHRIAEAGALAARAMLLGIAVGLLGGWIGTLITIYFINDPPMRRTNGILAGIVARFVATAVLMLVVYSSAELPPRTFLLWAAGAHFVLLVLETWLLVGLVQAVSRPESGEETA